MCALLLVQPSSVLVAVLITLELVHHHERIAERSAAINPCAGARSAQIDYRYVVHALPKTPKGLWSVIALETEYQ